MTDASDRHEGEVGGHVEGDVGGDAVAPDPDEALAAFAVLADTERLRVAGALLGGAVTTDEVVAVTRLATRRVLEALTKLETGGLAAREGSGWRFDVDRLRALARDARPRERPDDVGDDLPREAASVLRAFLRGGRLTQIPMQRGKRLVVLDHICRVFDVGVRYSEKEVNAYLRAFHPDTAALRRYLVDEGFLTREAGAYWRTGGSVEL